VAGVAAAVHLARRRSKEGETHEVAVKVFRSSQLNDAEHEAAMLEPFTGEPCIVTLDEVLYSLDWCALVLEYSPQGSLHHYLAGLPSGKLPESKLREHILHDMLAGMGALHARRIVHLDVKKDNVLLKPGGGAMWCDLGEARELPPLDDAAAGVFPDYEFGGKMPYVFTRRAPEVWHQRGGIGTLSDVWSIGTIALELFTPGALLLGADEEDQRRRIEHLPQLLTSLEEEGQGLAEPELRLVRALLAVEPRDRATCEAAIASSYFDSWRARQAPQRKVLRARRPGKPAAG